MMKLNKITLIGMVILISFSFLSQVSPFAIDMGINQEKSKPSGVIKWAFLDLYDPYGINNSHHQTGSDIVLAGKLYNPYLVPEGKANYTVVTYVDGTPYYSFNNVTDENGEFCIVYTIDPLLDLFIPHIIEVFVDDPLGFVVYTSYYNISLSTSSYFELHDPIVAKLLGENLEFEGYLRYESGLGISFESVNYFWYDGAMMIYSSNVFTDSEGEIDEIYIPDSADDSLTLKLSYSNPPLVAYSEVTIENPKIFSNITCDWNLPDTIVQNRQFRIRGQILSLNDPNLPINNRNFRIIYNSSVIANLTTNSDGFFDFTYLLSSGIGSVELEIEIVGPSGIISSSQLINIVTAPSTNPTDVPFMDFFTIFIPIIVGIIIGLAVYGFYRYRKSDKESRVVNLPLEDKILNLKILKESGRLEESLSYLFNAIYMDLIIAKYGRKRNQNETIRDFAIVSVTQLNLTPTAIYPFIQKVEEIIYAKPFQITEKEFYNTIELFSPIYYELTGYNFIVNF